MLHARIRAVNIKKRYVSHKKANKSSQHTRSGVDLHDFMHAYSPAKHINNI
ncbi:hypothetical protein NUITMVR1_17120 [Raoultella ornithinolytica]|nr:hypothetical protein NUITMVR1_17120 [Raoultella ornithinolytica]